MPDRPARTRSGAGRAAAMAAVCGGMIGFAWWVHATPPRNAASALALLVVAAGIVQGPAGPDLRAALGFGRFTRRTGALSIAALALGLGVGMAHRYRLDLPLLPQTPLAPFVWVACLVGATEELLYRGWLMGAAREWGWPAAVVAASAAHVAYKTALFAGPGVPPGLDLMTTAAWTAGGGIVLGALRAATDSVLPPIAAHTAFDLVVYGAVSVAPWWVWG